MPKVGIFNDTSVSGHYGCTAVMQTVMNELAARGSSPAYLWPVAKDWQPYVAQLDNNLPRFILVNGEGTIHHTIERKRARDLLEVASYAQERRIPAHLINASISEVDPDSLQHLRMFTSISVRESESLQYLAERGIEASLTPDLSLGLAGFEAQRPRSGIMVTDSVLPGVARSLRSFSKNVSGHHERMKPSFTKWERFVHDARGVFGSSLVKRWHPRADPRAFAKRMMEKDLIVTGRFHSVLLAILTDTPFLAVGSNTRKIEAVLNDVFGSTNRMVSIKDLESPEFIKSLKTASAFDDAETKSVGRYREMAAERRRTLFNRLVESAD